MKIINESAIPTRTMLPLINFTRRYFWCRDDFLLKIFNHTDKRPGIVGSAEKIYPNWIKGSEFNLVQLQMNPQKKFKRKDMYRKAAGPVYFKSWEENFIMVLAHELRHIDQFTSENIPYHMEVDAEKYAMLVLNEYRKRKV